MSKEARITKYYIIGFSGEDITMNGTPIEDVRKEEVLRMNVTMKRAGKELSKEEEEFVSNNILNKRDAEKQILHELVANSRRKEAKSLARFNKLNCLAEEIEDSEESIKIESEELEWLRKSFDSKLGDEKNPMPDWWGNCSELLNQLENPKEVATEEKAVEEKKA